MSLPHDSFSLFISFLRNSLLKSIPSGIGSPSLFLNRVDTQVEVASQLSRVDLFSSCMTQIQGVSPNKEVLASIVLIILWTEL